MESLTITKRQIYAQTEPPNLFKLIHNFKLFKKAYNKRAKENGVSIITSDCEKLVEELIRLALNQNKNSKIGYPDDGIRIDTLTASLATTIEKDERTVRNYYKQLENLGLILKRGKSAYYRVELFLNIHIDQNDINNGYISRKIFPQLVLEAQGAPELEKITYTDDSIFLDKNYSEPLEQKKELVEEKSWSKIFEEQLKEQDKKLPEKEKYVRNGKKLLFQTNINPVANPEPQEQKKIEVNIALSSQENHLEVKNSIAKLQGKEYFAPDYFKNLGANQIDNEVLIFGQKIWTQINDKIYCGYFSKNHQNTDWGLQCAKIILFFHQKLGNKDVTDSYLKTQKLIFFIKRWIDKTHFDAKESDKIKGFVPGHPSYYLDICEGKGTRFVNALQWEFDFKERKNATNARITIENMARKCRQGKSPKEASELHENNLKIVSANPILTTWYNSNLINLFPNGIKFKR